MNKKSQELDGILMLFANFIAIGVLIMLGVSVMYAADFDVRISEAKTISDRLVSAVSDGGYVNPLALQNNFNIINSAGLDGKQFFNGGKFYFNITILQNGKLINSFQDGTKDFEVQCKLSGNNLAKCFYKNVFVIDKDNNLYEINILTASNQQGSKL